MSTISIYLPYILFSLPFVVALLVLVKTRRDRRIADETADYERFIWSEKEAEEEAASRPIGRSYISYSA